MCSTSIFPCVITMISNFTIFFYLSHIHFEIVLYKYNRFLHFHMIPAVFFLITSFFLFKINYSIACSLKDSQNFFIQSLALYTSCLLSTLLNDDIVDTEKPDGICSPTFVVNE